MGNGSIAWHCLKSWSNILWYLCFSLFSILQTFHFTLRASSTNSGFALRPRLAASKSICNSFFFCQLQFWNCCQNSTHPKTAPKDPTVAPSTSLIKVRTPNSYRYLRNNVEFDHILSILLHHVIQLGWLRFLFKLTLLERILALPTRFFGKIGVGELHEFVQPTGSTNKSWILLIVQKSGEKTTWDV